MTKLQMLTASLAMTLLLSASAFADDGIIEVGKTPPPPPPPASSTTETAPAEADGIMGTGAPSAAETVTEVAAALLDGVLALF